jgi:formamidopyrimidine-DNA glycosylase
MPELPEVETVRRGLEQGVVGRVVSDVEHRHPRALRRHEAGPEDFASRLRGRRFAGAHRRGKYLWLPLDEPASGEALLAHLGMSGQLLLRPIGEPDEDHLRARFRFTDDGPELRYVDQRTFGGLALSSGSLTEEGLPTELAHVAPDPLDKAFDEDRLIRRLRSRRTGLKRALLDQTLVSGIGNIYADEALWRAKLHFARPTQTMTRPELSRLMAEVHRVFAASLRDGGTSFDAMYVDVDGSSGYFGRHLAVYGREGLPCERCGSAIRREPFMNRSSFYCPRCQPRPRRPHPASDRRLSGAVRRGPTWSDQSTSLDRPRGQVRP